MKIYILSVMKMHFKMSFARRRSFCTGLSVSSVRGFAREDVPVVTGMKIVANRGMPAIKWNTMSGTRRPMLQKWYHFILWHSITWAWCNTRYPSETHLKTKPRKISFFYNINFRCPDVFKTLHKARHYQCCAVRFTIALYLCLTVFIYISHFVPLSLFSVLRARESCSAFNFFYCIWRSSYGLLQVEAAVRESLDFLYFEQNIYITRTSNPRYMVKKTLPGGPNGKAFDMNPVIGVKVPLGIRHSLPWNWWPFPKTSNSRSKTDCISSSSNFYWHTEVESNLWAIEAE